MKRKFLEHPAANCFYTLIDSRGAFAPRGSLRDRSPRRLRGLSSLAWVAASCALACTHAPDLATETFPESQAAVRTRLDEIWAAAGARDLERLASYHLYGPKFTEFKDGARRGDAVTNQQGERAFFSAARDAKAEMKDLRVTVFGDVAIATFNGEFSATMNGESIAAAEQATLVFVKQDGAWKIVHEHFSPLGGSAPGP